MTESTNKIVVLKSIRAITRQLSNDEKSMLRRSLNSEGCRDSLVCFEHKGKLILLDGHNRYNICRQDHIKYRIKILKGVHTLSRAKIWVIKNQLARRNLTTTERAALATTLETLYRKVGKANQSKAGEEHGRGKKTSHSTITKINSRQQAAKDAGVGESTLKEYKNIMEKGSEEQKKRLQSGDVSINKINNELIDEPTASFTFTFGAKIKNEIKDILRAARDKEGTKNNSDTFVAILKRYKSAILDK